jgi:hypothetical protein
VNQKAFVILCQTPENELMSVLWRKKRKTISMRIGTYRENMNSLPRFSSDSFSIWILKSVMKKIQRASAANTSFLVVFVIPLQKFFFDQYEFVRETKNNINQEISCLWTIPIVN